MAVVEAVEAGPHVDVVGSHAEHVRDDLRRRRLVTLPLRGGTERHDDLAEQVELHRCRLVVPREGQLRIHEPRLREVVRARVERRADADPDQLAARLVSLALADRAVVDELEREVEGARVVAGVVDAPVDRRVRHLVRPHVVALAHLDRIDAELPPDDVEHALDEPEVLKARVAAVRPARRLVRAHLLEVDADVPDPVAAGRDLRPDHAADRLVPWVRAASSTAFMR